MIHQTNDKCHGVLSQGNEVWFNANCASKSYLDVLWCTAFYLQGYGKKNRHFGIKYDKYYELLKGLFSESFSVCVKAVLPKKWLTLKFGEILFS